jgi:hypothetical protein
LIRDSEPLAWHVNEIKRILDLQRQLDRPIIIEGVLLLKVLQSIRYEPDFLLFVEKDLHDSTMQKHTSAYLKTFQPKSKANLLVRWSSADYDERVVLAHLRLGGATS